MGILDNIQSGLEDAVRGFGQTFVPMYQQSIQTPIKMKLENYLMQKRLDAQMEAYKERIQYTQAQQVKQSIAKNTAMSYTSLTDAVNVIDKIRDTQIDRLKNDYNIDVDLKNITVEDLLNEKKIKTETKSKILDIMRTAEERKAGIFLKQINRNNEKLKEVKDDVEKMGIISATNDLMQQHSAIENNVSNLSTKKISLLSNENIYPSDVIKAKTITSSSKKAELELDAMVSASTPDNAVKNSETLLGTFNKFLGKYSFDKKINNILKDDNLSDIDKTKSINFLNKIMTTIVSFKQSEKLRQITKSGGSSGITKSLYNLLGEASDYKYNVGVKRNVDMVRESIKSGDSNKVIYSIAGLKQSISKAKTDFQRGKNTFNLFIKQIRQSKKEVENGVDILTDETQNIYDDFVILGEEFSRQLSSGEFSLPVLKNLDTIAERLLKRDDVLKNKRLKQTLKSFKKKLPMIYKNITGGANIKIKTDVISSPKQIKEKPELKNNDNVKQEQKKEMSTYNIDNILDNINLYP